LVVGFKNMSDMERKESITNVPSTPEVCCRPRRENSQCCVAAAIAVVQTNGVPFLFGEVLIDLAS
jgi:hypothetical protein